MSPKFFRGLGLIAALVALILTLGAVSAQEMKVLRTDGCSTPIPSLDPALATDACSIQVLKEAYIGLTHLDEATQEVMPGLAESWEVVENADGTATYTFHLRNDISWVRYNAESGAVEQVMVDGSPRMVNAHDVAYGWTRTLDPRTAGEYAYVLYPQVVGGTEFNQQFSDVAEGTDITTLELTIGPETLGFRAVDDFTFEVTAPERLVFQPSIYGMWMAYPQPQWVIEEFADFWTNDENYVAYGPFAVKEWSPDEVLVLTKNPFWPGNEVAPVSTIDEVHLLTMDAPAALAEYEAGNLDYVDAVPTSDIPRIKADATLSAEYFQGTTQGTTYYGFGVNFPPMDNVHLRRAFSYAIDREDVVENVLRGGQVPARFFSNPGLNAAPLQENYPDLGIGYDPDLAQEELALALEELGLSSVDELPPITLAYNTSESNQRVSEAFQQIWLEELGIEVQLTSMEFATFLDQRDEFQIQRNGWGSDYPDNHNFLFDVFHTSSTNDDTGWTNPEFDALVEEAARLDDVEARRELYAQADHILVYEDAAIIPLWYSSDPELTKPYIERTYGLSGTQQFEKWDISN